MTQSEEIHGKLREMILSLALSPGEKFSERWLETLFEGSRTPIRAALFRLESEELVCRDGRGWMIAPIDTDEIGALAVYREALETASVRLVCEHATDDELEGISAILDASQPGAPSKTLHQTGTDFHVALARLSGNRFISKSLEAAMTRLSRVRWLEVFSEARRVQSDAEHRRILACICARDAEGAAREVAQHIRDTRDRLLYSLQHERQYLRAKGVTIVGKVA